MSTKKRGAGAATHNRAESQTQQEFKPSMADIQDYIRNVFAEVDRYQVRMNHLRDQWQPPEPDSERMLETAKEFIRVLHWEHKKHHMFMLYILLIIRYRAAVEHWEELVFKRGLFCLFFIDQNGKWFMRRESGEWGQERKRTVQSAMQALGISTSKTKENNGLSEFDCVYLWFDLNRLELHQTVRDALEAGERLPFSEIYERCSPKYVQRVKGMETMYREFGAHEGWRF